MTLIAHLGCDLVFSGRFAQLPGFPYSAHQRFLHIHRACPRSMHQTAAVACMWSGVAMKTASIEALGV
jgi:hypothetical protein